jgi:hypothetical protein
MASRAAIAAHTRPSLAAPQVGSAPLVLQGGR